LANKLQASGTTRALLLPLYVYALLVDGCTTAYRDANGFVKSGNAGIRVDAAQVPSVVHAPLVTTSGKFEHTLF
jgi:hypothetical protein